MNKRIEIKHFEFKQLCLSVYFLPLNHSLPSSRFSIPGSYLFYTEKQLDVSLSFNLASKKVWDQCYMFEYRVSLRTKILKYIKIAGAYRSLHPRFVIIAILLSGPAAS